MVRSFKFQLCHPSGGFFAQDRGRQRGEWDSSGTVEAENSATSQHIFFRKPVTGTLTGENDHKTTSSERPRTTTDPPLSRQSLCGAFTNVSTHSTMNTNPILHQKRVSRFLGLPLIALFTLSAQAQTPPTITRQPVSQSHSLGATATFTVSATGSSPLSYQWQHNDADLGGAISRTLTLTNLSLIHAGTYRVTVSNAAGTTISDPAELDVDSTFTKIATGDYVRASENGVAWGDYDGDGLLDLYSGGSSVYRNNPDRPGTFTRTAITSGINTTDGAFGMWADSDNDDDLDLFVPLGSDGVSQPNRFLRNEGNGRFQRITTGSFLNDMGPTSFAAWGDYDRDGFLDLFCANFEPGTSTASYLYHNNRDGTFTRVQAWQIATYTTRAFACNWVDVNGDGWLDVTVGTNPGGQVVCWENQQGQGFERFVLPGGGGPYILCLLYTSPSPRDS